MRKQKRGRKLSRKRDQRNALIRSLARSLFLHGKIRTTEAKAKELSRFAEKQIARAKEDTLASKRGLAHSFSWSMVKKLTEEIAPKYKEREGGYTRITKLAPRTSDGARMVVIELV